MLKIIYGKSGTGKSQKIYEDIKENLLNEKIFLIVPEQSNLTTEQNLINYLNVKSLINCQVLTLSRMAFRILEEQSKENRKTLTKSGKAMIIYDILKKEEKKLKFLGKSDRNVDIIINIITELKKHNITEEILGNTEISDEYTRLKIEDIKLIYQKYNDKIKENFIDENDILSIIAEKIKYSKMFENSLIYIDNFNGFTPQEYIVFEELLKASQNISVAVTADNLEVGDKELDLFYFNKIFAKKLIEIAKKNNKNIKLDFCEKNLRINNEELNFLEKSLSSNKFKVYDKELKNIKLFLANNPYSEIEYIAEEILKLVKEENYKYNEIAIVTNNLEEYSLDSKVIFDKYNIPVFIDEKKDLNQNILIKYILAILDIYSKNWSYESVFNFLKIGMLDISEYDIFSLENYCKKWGIKYNKWFKEFNYEEINEEQTKLEILRKKIVNPIIEFKSKASKNKTAKEITKCLYDFLINNHVDQILDNKIKQIGSQEINSEYNTSYKILVQVLDTIVECFGNEKMDFDKYRELLQIGFSQSELGKITMSQDQVILGDSKRSRNSNIKVTFILRSK